MLDSELPRLIPWQSKLRHVFSLSDFKVFVRFLFKRREDVWFDRRYGTDTWHHSRLPGTKREKARDWPYGYMYEPSLIAPFRQLMDFLVTKQLVGSNSVFVDVGSGKGLVTMLVAEYGCKRVIGVEKAPQLCVTARRNIALYNAATGNAIPIDIIESDAAYYDIPSDADVFYFFNPFNSETLRAFIENLQHSLAENSRPVLLIFCHPKHLHVVEASGDFQLLERRIFEPIVTVVYGNKPAAPEFAST